VGDGDRSESPTLYLDFGAGFWSERRCTGSGGHRTPCVARGARPTSGNNRG